MRKPLRKISTKIYMQFTNLEVIKFECKIEDFCELFEQRLLDLQMLFGCHVIWAELS